MYKKSHWDLVVVDWIDSCGVSSTWKSSDELEKDCEALLCQSVGWLAKETDTAIVIVPHRAIPNALCDEQICGDMTIPKIAIKKLQKLAEESASEID